MPRRAGGMLACALLLGALGASPALATPVDEQIVLRQRASLSLGDRADLRAAAGVTLDERLTLTGVDVVTSAAGDREAALDALRRDPDVLWAEPSEPVRVSTADPLFGQQYALENTGSAGRLDADIDAPQAWAVSRGSGVTVAVVDTGVEAEHPDLAGQLVTGVNVVADGHTTADDGEGHGTHVAGIIAAAENTIGVVGVAPAGKVQAYRALGDDGSGTTQGIAVAFNAAAAAGLRIVNASLGSPGYSNVEAQAIAAHPDTLFVVAAGNDSANLDGGTVVSPCSLEMANVLCVGASDAYDRPAAYSDYGRRTVDLFAPGTRLLSTVPGGDYDFLSGTSMASPVVAGAAALLAAAHPTWVASDLKAALMRTADQPSALGAVSVSGGRVNAARALGVPVGPDGHAPTIVVGLSATGVDHGVDLRWQPSAALDLADYRIARFDGSDWVTAAVVDPAAATASITGLVPGRTEAFRITARDGSGEESVASAEASALVLGTDEVAAAGAGAAGGTEASGAGPGAGGQVAAAAPGQSGGAAPSSSGNAGEAGASPAAEPPPSGHLSKLRVITGRGRPTGIRLHLSAAGSVTIRAERRRAAGVPARTVRVVRRLPAGTSTVALGRASNALNLARGTWRLTVTAPVGRATTTLRIR